MRIYKIQFDKSDREIETGLREVMRKFPDRFTDNADAVKISFRKQIDADAGLTVTKGETLQVVFREKSDAFRALGRILGEEASNNQNFNESSAFATRGVMFDVSRNGVLKPKVVCDLLRHIALMGLNMAMLYTEDVFEIEDEPFFGYLRGKYTVDELRSIDQYADLFGIEMFPCIQTLGHMYEIFQWPAFQMYSDTHQIFLADDEPTYQFIEKMIKAASKPYKSNRIHIGMDEAKEIGSGRYRDIHGDQERLDIFLRHLNRVNGICEKLDLRPMMWSDMFFKLASTTQDDYGEASPDSDALKERIPKGVQQIYWDYYHTDREHYSAIIAKHKEFGSNPIMAGGVWTWNRFWTTLPFTFNATEPCVQAAREQGLDEVFMTLWGDGGMECDIYSALPGLQYFAELAYSEEIEPKLLRANFRGSCATSFDDYVKASDLDAVPSLENPEDSYGNVSKWLLWQDIFLGIMDPLMADVDLSGHYEQLGRYLKSVADKDELSKRLIFPALTADTLAIKAHLTRRIMDAYKQNDLDALRKIIDETLPKLKTRVDSLWRAHRKMWLATYKPFGWEVIERNYGFLTLRLDTAAMRLNEFINGECDSIPELDEPRQKIFNIENGGYPLIHASRMISPTVIK